MTPGRRSMSAAARRRDMIWGTLLIAAAILPFVTVWPRQFVNWDDRSNVVDNGPVRHATPTNVGYVFTHAIGANYVPLTWLSHMVDWQVWGDDAWGHAVTNALLHAVCCCLVVLCLRRGGLDPTGSWLAGMLFAVHPIHAEPVDWISGRKDLLCAAALLACQFAYMGWRDSARRTSWLASLAWLIVAALGKPAAMSAIVSLALYDLLWLRRSWRDAARSLVPFAAVCLVVAVVAVFAQRSGSAFAAGTDRRWGAFDLVACNLLFELWRCWIPARFSPFVPNSILEDLPSAVRWLAPAALVAASVALATRASRGQLWRAVAWWWFGSLAFLLPVSGVIPLGYTSLADRYLYLPSLGPCVFLAIGVGRVERPIFKAVLTAALVLMLAAATHSRAGAWKDSITLWQTTLTAFPRAEIAWRNLTSAYYQHDELEEAARTAQNGLQSIPRDLNLAINAAVVLTDLGRYSEADAVLSAASEIHPRAAEVSNQRGLLALRQGQVEQARAHFELASSQRPEWDLPYLNLSYAFDQRHDFQRALDAARQAVKLSPRDADPSRRVVDLLLKEGRIAEALDALEQMTADFPYDSLGWQNRIGLLRQIGRTTEADEVARTAARYISPERLR